MHQGAIPGLVSPRRLCRRIVGPETKHPPFFTVDASRQLSSHLVRSRQRRLTTIFPERRRFSRHIFATRGVRARASNFSSSSPPLVGLQTLFRSCFYERVFPRMVWSTDELRIRLQEQYMGDSWAVARDGALIRRVVCRVIAGAVSPTPAPPSLATSLRGSDYVFHSLCRS